MSTSQSFPGATYTFGLANGESGALFPASHIQTSRGRVDLPGEDVLALQGTVYNGTLYMSGQGHDSGFAWLYDGHWRHIVQTALATFDTFGVRPCAFGDGILCISTSGYSYEVVTLATGAVEAHMLQIGSQGIRFVNEQNQPVTGDQTIYDGHIHEWIERGGVRLGQGHTGGAILNGHVIEPGDCQFMTFDKQGDQIGIGIVKFPEGRAVTHVLSVSEIVDLPLPTAPPVPPVQPPAPVPVPQPIPEPKPVTNQLPTIQRIRAKYPTPLGAQHPAFLIEAAQQTGAKLLRKDGGTHVTLPNGVNVSQDILMFGDQGVDILGDGEGAATPGWGEKGTIAGDYIDVSGMGTPAPSPVPTPQPVPQPPAVDLGPLKAQIAELQEQNAANGRRTDALEAVIAALTDKVQQPKQYRVVGSTGRTYGHAHSVNVTLEEIK